MCNTFNNLLGYDSNNNKSALDGLIGMRDLSDNFFLSSETLMNKLNNYANKKKASNAEDKQDQNPTGEESSCKSETCGCLSEETRERKRRETEEDEFNQTKFLYEAGVVIRKRLEESIEENSDYPEEFYVTISLVRDEAHIRTEVRDEYGEAYQTKSFPDWMCEAFFDEVTRFGSSIRSGVSNDEFGPYFYIQKVFRDGEF